MTKRRIIDILANMGIIEKQNISAGNNKLEDFNSRGVDIILAKILENGRPHSPDAFLQEWSKLLGKNMYYDGFNYAISKGYDPEGDAGLWISNIPQESIQLTGTQRTILIKHLKEYISEDRVELSEQILRLIKSLETNNMDEFIKIFINYPSLQNIIGNNEGLWKDWEKYYRSLPLDAILNIGIGSCKVFSLLSKQVIEHGSRKWGLGVNRVELHENIDGHVVLRVYLHNGRMILFDSLSPIYNVNR